MAFIEVLLAFLCAVSCCDVVHISFEATRVYYVSLDFVRVVREDRLAVSLALVKKFFREEDFFEVKVVWGRMPVLEFEL